jgi:Kef-type K+ transport system membrane component KefB
MSGTLSPFLQFAFAIILILIVAKVGGFISTRLGQPSVLGELLAGILLGPSILNITRLPFITDSQQLEEFIRDLGELGVLLLMFLAGLELHFSDMLKNARVSARIAILGVILSVVLTGLVGVFSGLGLTQAFFLGLALAATSISISAQTLMELKVLRSKIGFGLLGAAVLDDILVLILFSIFVAVYGGSNGWQSAGELILRVVVFLFLSLGFGLFLLPKVSRWITLRQVSQGSITFAIVTLLTFGLLAELIGNLSAILGAFLAGLMFSRTEEKANVDPGLRTLTYSLFAPVFFVSIGLQVDLHLIRNESFLLLLGLAAAAAFGKFGGAGLGARISGFSWLESSQLGVGMIPRGEVSLIIASVGLNLGILDSGLFTAIIGAVLVTTLITPSLLRYTFSKKEKQDNKKTSEEEREIR